MAKTPSDSIRIRAHDARTIGCSARNHPSPAAPNHHQRAASRRLTSSALVVMCNPPTIPTVGWRLERAPQSHEREQIQ